MSKKILIITPFDGDTMNDLLSKFKEEFRTLPIEIQAPVILTDMIYKQMKKKTERSYFHCFLSSLNSYKKINDEGSVFITNAPIKIMLGASDKDILYHEVWVYDINITSTQETYMEDYMSDYGDEVQKYLNLYKSTQATRRFKNFKSLLGAILKELSKEMDNEL